jgi:hypothetical protein
VVLDLVRGGLEKIGLYRHYYGLLIKNSNFMSSNLVRPHQYIVCLCGQEEARETKRLKSFKYLQFSNFWTLVNDR